MGLEIRTGGTEGSGDLGNHRREKGPKVRGDVSGEVDIYWWSEGGAEAVASDTAEGITRV